MAERGTTERSTTERSTTGPEPSVMPRRWGPASWWRVGLVALLALLVGLALAGGAFWTATPVDAPR